MSTGIVKALRALRAKFTKAQLERMAQARHAAHRAKLMDAARAAFTEGREVASEVNGSLWWPALAPLKPYERRIVRRDVGLRVS